MLQDKEGGEQGGKSPFSLLSEPISPSSLFCSSPLQRDIKNVIKRGGHHACFHATMLTNMVIKVTFGDLRTQQISLIIFQCGVLYHTEFDFLWLFIHLRPRKKWLQIPCIIN